LTREKYRRPHQAPYFKCIKLSGKKKGPVFGALPFILFQLFNFCNDFFYHESDTEISPQ